MAEEQNQNAQPQSTDNEVQASRVTSEDIDAYLKSQEEQSAPQEILMQWSAKEFQQVSRPQQWYILFAIAGIALVVYAIISTNYLFALIVVILAIVLNNYFHKKPKDISIAITREGIVIDNTFYAYGEDISSFWILYNPPEIKSLHFGRNSTLRQTLTIELEDQNPLKVRETLLNYLPEDIEQEEHPVDATFRRLGF